MDEAMKENVQNFIDTEDDETILGYFVSNVGYDYLEHEKKHVAQIHPDFSEETKMFWEAIEKRMKGAVVLDFDREGYIAALKKKANDQEYHCKTVDETSSYHYGLNCAYWNAIGLLNKYTKDLSASGSGEDPQSDVSGDSKHHPKVLYAIKEIATGRLIFSARGGAYTDYAAVVKKLDKLGEGHKIVRYKLEEG